nr:MAG TPA: hypothetical protein [Bacteriophage sp.]
MADAKGAYIGGAPVQFKDAAARKMISDEYNSAETYAKGNLCIYNGKIYEAIKETIGTWDATAWKETTLAEVNAKMRSDITNLTEKNEYPVTSGYPIMLNDVTMMGNNVNANIGIRKNDGFPDTYTEIATLNNKTFPKTVIRFPCIVTSTSDGSIIGYGEVKIDTNGKLYVRSSVKKNYSEIYFFASWEI